MEICVNNEICGQQHQCVPAHRPPCQGVLRTSDTIEKFKRVPVQPGTTSPLLVYFGTLLTKSKLNAYESVELSKLVLSQNKKHLLDNWLKEQKLTPSEELGDLFRQAGDQETALSLYQGANSTTKVIESLAAKGDFDALMNYAKSQGYQPDYMYLMQTMMMSNPDAAVNLAKMVCKQPGPPIDLYTLTDVFLSRNAIREATAFLLDVLQDNDPKNAMLQTKARAHTLVDLFVGLHVGLFVGLHVACAAPPPPTQHPPPITVAGDQPGDQPPSGRRHPGQWHADALRPPTRGPAVRKGRPVHACAAALHRPARHQARHHQHARHGSPAARRVLWHALSQLGTRVPAGAPHHQHAAKLADRGAGGKGVH